MKWEGLEGREEVEQQCEEPSKEALILVQRECRKARRGGFVEIEAAREVLKGFGRRRVENEGLRSRECH